MYVVFPEVMSVDDRILACARWLQKKGCSDIQHDDVPVVGLAAVGLDCGPEDPELSVVRLLMFAWRKVAPFIVLVVLFV